MTLSEIAGPSAARGLGTGDVESLTSAVRRLAWFEVRSVSEMLRTRVTAPWQRENNARHAIFEPTRLTEAINGSTVATDLVVSSLRKEAGHDFAATTLIGQDTALEFREAFRAVRAWCPACLAAGGEGAYDRLSWALRSSAICVHHHVRLTESCGSCGRSHRPWHAMANPWTCPHCGALLENASRIGVAEADRGSELVVALIARIRSGRPIAQSEVLATFGALISVNGGLKRLATRLGCSPSGLCSITTGSTRPHLELYLRALLLTEWIADPASGSATLKEAWTRRARPPPRRADYSSLGRALRQVARAKGTPPSLRAFAGAHRVDVATLRARFPEATAAITRRRADHLRHRTETADRVLCQRVRKAFDALVAHGVVPSRRDLEAALAQPGLFRAPSAREVYRHAIETAFFSSSGSGRFRRVKDE